MYDVIAYGILAAAIVLQSIIHYKERKDLYTRIMCRDVHDYTATVSPIVKNPHSAASEVLKKWRDRE